MTGTVLGYDPGGDGAHGVAVLQFDENQATALATSTLESVEDVISTLECLPALAALGVDTLTCWGTGRGGWRPADRWLRDRYPAVRNSVMSPNSLFGSMGLNGMGALIAARHKFRDVLITETHPKVLYWHLSSKKHEYLASKAEMDDVLSRRLNVPVATANEHEWDAALSVLAALNGLLRYWTQDLHALPISEGERLITPCGETHYFWPE